MSDRPDGEPRLPALADEDDWFATPFQEPVESGEVAWQDEPEPPPPPAPPGLGQRQAIVVGASVAAVILIAALILGVRAIGGSDETATTTTPVTTPIETTSTTTTSTTTTPTTTTSTTPTSTTPTSTTPTVTSVPTDVVLKAGSTGTSVVALQQALTQLGYEPGTADGKFGTATTQAVSAFQTAQGLAADGIAGPTTLAAVNTALAAG